MTSSVSSFRFILYQIIIFTEWSYDSNEPHTRRCRQRDWQTQVCWRFEWDTTPHPPLPVTWRQIYLCIVKVTDVGRPKCPSIHSETSHILILHGTIFFQLLWIPHTTHSSLNVAGVLERSTWPTVLSLAVLFYLSLIICSGLGSLLLPTLTQCLRNRVTLSARLRFHTAQRSLTFFSLLLQQLLRNRLCSEKLNEAPSDRLSLSLSFPLSLSPSPSLSAYQ